MSNAPQLLDEDGSASVATAVLMSHHGLRRDIARFAVALRRVDEGDNARSQLLLEEWQRYRATLHGHHEAEDTRMFPHFKAQHPGLAATIDRLSSDHRRIDPLLDRADRAFAKLPRTEAAAEVVAELTRLLDEHLATEEATVVPLLREVKSFPPPASEEEAAIYADGFAWSSHGVDSEVVRKMDALLPAELQSRLASARSAFAVRFARVWGSADAGASRTALPER